MNKYYISLFILIFGFLFWTHGLEKDKKPDGAYIELVYIPSASSNLTKKINYGKSFLLKTRDPQFSAKTTAIIEKYNTIKHTSTYTYPDACLYEFKISNGKEVLDFTISLLLLEEKETGLILEVVDKILQTLSEETGFSEEKFLEKN